MKLNVPTNFHFKFKDNVQFMSSYSWK